MAGKAVAAEELKTAGNADAIKLTVHTSPDGLQADGEDAALIDLAFLHSCRINGLSRQVVSADPVGRPMS
jgi:hypothetical protein